MKKAQLRGIDSIRAVGVVLVVVYHLFTKVLPAGFFGVDLFFVISGFLVTSLFLIELENTERIDFIGFFVRRVKRLMPAAVFMIVVTLSLSLLLSPDLRVGLREQTAAVFGWVTNWFEIAGGQSYEEQFLPHLFVHTWTLGLEMQYYLAWGMTVFIIIAACNSPEKRLSQCKWGMVIAAIGFAVFSYVWMQYMSVGTEDPSPAYYATTSRVFPLMIGSALGALTAMRPPKKVPHAGVSIAGLAVCILTICFMARALSFADPFTYKWGILIVSVLSAFAIWFVLALQSNKWFRDVKLLAIIGRRSYSIYLFHWPIYNVFRQLATMGSGLLLWKIPQPVYAGISLIFTVLLAEVSFCYFEKIPSLRKEDLKRIWRRLPVVAISCALLLCLSIVNLATVPLRTKVEENYLRQQTLVSINGMDRYGDYLKGLDLNPVLFHGQPDQLPPAPSEHATYISRGPVIPYNPSGSGLTSEGQWINVFGDSVTLGAADYLFDTLQTVFVDARESRNMGAAIALMNDWAAKNQLTDYIVLALFTNTQNFTQQATLEFLDAVPQGKRIIVVTPYGNGNMEAMAEWLRGLPAEYPYVTVADWNLAIRDRTDLLAPDGMHMQTGDGMQLYANIIGEAIDQASQKPAKE